MPLTRARAALSVALIAASGAALLAASAPASAARSHPAGQASSRAAAHRVVIVNCLGRPVIRPRSYVLTCADANDSLAGMGWTSWRSTAFGHGTNVVNTCVPNCAGGKFRKYPVLAVLWRATPRPQHHGQRYFSRLTLIYTGRIPAGFHRTYTTALPSGLTR